jgi:hypothetical protein
LQAGAGNKQCVLLHIGTEAQLTSSSLLLLHPLLIMHIYLSGAIHYISCVCQLLCAMGEPASSSDTHAALHAHALAAINHGQFCELLTHDEWHMYCKQMQVIQRSQQLCEAVIACLPTWHAIMFAADAK